MLCMHFQRKFRIDLEIKGARWDLQMSCSDTASFQASFTHSRVLSTLIKVDLRWVPRWIWLMIFVNDLCVPPARGMPDSSNVMSMSVSISRVTGGFVIPFAGLMRTVSKDVLAHLSLSLAITALRSLKPGFSMLFSHLARFTTI